MSELAKPLTAPAQAVQDTAGRGQGVKSREAARLVDDLLRAPVEPRRAALRELAPAEWQFILREVQRETGTLYGLWADTPSGFVEDVCGESLWAKQREVLDAIPVYKRVAVPAGFGVGKTHLAGRAVAWFGCTTPVGTGLIVTTATRFRQVRNQLWPHIRRVIARAGLPGETDTVQWKIPDAYGNDVLVAYGFTAPANDEAAMQGIHAARLLLIVDEAGGIARTIGNGTNNLLTGDARMLAIGNPPADDPRSWFETLCEEGDDPEVRSTVTIPIAATDSPAITGQPTPPCRDCPAGVPAHSLATHLPDTDWVERTVREYGPDHPYVVAKVHARFPKGGGNKVIPPTWVEAAQDTDDPDPTGEYVRPCDLGLDGESDTFSVRRGAWVRLGVDVAADGGDEFTIYRCIGDVLHPRHASSGSVNSNQVDVAEQILAEILAAERLAAALGSTAPVRVKVDKNGLGHGAVGMLERWRATGRHSAQIVGVMVSESPEREDEGAVMRPYRKRDEMWLAMRGLLQPDPSTGLGRMRLRLDHKAAVQMSLPNLGSNSAGFAVVESKKSLKARGLNSPDRAEGALLAVYEPHPIGRRKNRGLLN